MRGALVNHVDDILLAAPKEEIKELQKSLSGIFPISEWESDTFEYIGSDIEQNDNSIHVGQSNYVKSRLQTVDIPKGVNPEEVADEVTRLDNQSVVGGLSWLASQTRPDLQTGVSMAQRKQTRRQGDEQGGKVGAGEQGGEADLPEGGQRARGARRGRRLGNV